MEYIIKHLQNTEYSPTRTPKDTIYLHHTAGSHRPDWVIDAWSQDKDKTGNRIRVATSYVIGGISTRNGESSFDGKVYEAFSPNFWAHHLGIKAKNNTILNQKSIGIEICNYGPLTMSRDGRFFTYVKSEIPDSMVVELPIPFRGSKYYQAYTSAQIESTRALIIDLSEKFNIDLSRGLKKEIQKFELIAPEFRTVLQKQIWLNRNGFTDQEGKKLTEDGKDGARTQAAFNKYSNRPNPLELNGDALAGTPGIWSHTNVRTDKSDIFPQPEILQMIRSL
jgi:hypothetical protein